MSTKVMSSISPVEFPRISPDCSLSGSCLPSEISEAKIYPYYPYSSNWNFAFAIVLIIMYFVFIFIAPALALPLLVIYMLVAYIILNSNSYSIYRKRTLVVAVETGQKLGD